MKDDEIYQAWKEQKSQIKIDDNFQSKILDDIYKHENANHVRQSGFEKFLIKIMIHPFARYGIFAIGFILACTRFLFGVRMALGTLYR